MGALTHDGEVLQRLPADASQINFDKTGTDLNSTQTENAIKEVNTKANTNTADITQLQNDFTSKIGVTQTTNLNECTASGVYTFPWDATGVPSGHSGAMLVLRNSNADTGLQIARLATENTIYVRFFDNSVFTAWQTITLSS